MSSHDFRDRHRSLPIVDRLEAASAEIAEEIADAVAEAVPERYRRVTDGECRPLCRALVPVALKCIARGDTPGDDRLDPIRLSARRVREQERMPASVMLGGIRAAMVRFTAIVIRYATPADAPSIITVMGRAAVLNQLFATVFVSGTEIYAARRPEWWSHQPEVAKRTLELVSEGLSTREIANILSYSEPAISYHLGNLMRRFGCSNRTELVSRAYETGVLPAA